MTDAGLDFPLSPIFDNLCINLISRCENIESNALQICIQIFDSRIEEDQAKQVYRIEAREGVPIVIRKAVAYHTSRGVPVTELFDRCRRTLDRVSERGFDSFFEGQRAWLDDFWANSDVEVGGQPAIQQAVRWCLFQLAQATARSDQLGIPAKGVTGSGYEGHYFWDTEIYLVPFLTYTAPRVARNALFNKKRPFWGVFYYRLYH